MSRLHNIRRVVTGDDAFLEGVLNPIGGFNIFKGDLVATATNPQNDTLTTFGYTNTLHDFRPNPGSLSVVSTSVNDTDGGTGVRTVRVRVRSSVTRIYTTTTLTLNGTTPVALTGPWDGMSAGTFAALTVGSTGSAVGTITASISGVTQSIIVPGRAQSVIVSAPIGIDQTGFIFNINIESRNPAIVSLTVRNSGTSLAAPFITVAEFFVDLSGPVNFNAGKGALVLPPLSDVDLRVKSLTPSNTITLYAGVFIALNSSL